jgi:hypothetical protein
MQMLDDAVDLSLGRYNRLFGCDHVGLGPLQLLDRGSLHRMQPGGPVSRFAGELQLRTPAIQLGACLGEFCPDVMDFVTVQLGKRLSSLDRISNIGEYPDDSSLSDGSDSRSFVFVHPDSAHHTQDLWQSLQPGFGQDDAAFPQG